jgi:hypothetical protein
MTRDTCCHIVVDVETIRPANPRTTGILNQGHGTGRVQKCTICHPGCCLFRRLLVIELFQCTESINFQEHADETLAFLLSPDSFWFFPLSHPFHAIRKWAAGSTTVHRCSAANGQRRTGMLVRTSRYQYSHQRVAKDIRQRGMCLRRPG